MSLTLKWAPAFFGDGWRSLDYMAPPGILYTSLEGYLRNLPGENGAYIGLIGIGIEIDVRPEVFVADLSQRHRSRG